MPVYPALSLAAAGLVVALELRVFRSGIFRQPAYWVAMAIVYAFMVPVDGWLTKLSAPIVIYRDGDTSGLRPVWDILAEEFVYAFALLTLVILVWDRAGRGEGAAADVSATSATRERVAAVADDRGEAP
jgi:lycopene cyclase domain-containing protein